eukprot:4007612-Amphidinium_carterae.1
MGIPNSKENETKTKVQTIHPKPLRSANKKIPRKQLNMIEYIEQSAKKEQCSIISGDFNTKYNALFFLCFSAPDLQCSAACFTVQCKGNRSMLGEFPPFARV